MKRKIVITGLCLFGLLAVACQQKMNTTSASVPRVEVEPAKESDTTGKTVAAAKAFLATLDDAGRAKVSFPFNSEQKTKWSNFPVGIYPRNGLRLGDLSAPQRDAEMKLLATVLSEPGLKKVKEIMEGDEVLKATDTGPGGPPPGGPPSGEPQPAPQGSPQGAPPASPSGAPQGGRQGESRGGPPRDIGFGRDNYYIAFLGAPSLTDPWMIQFGGHHLALNITIVGKANVMTPSLPAAQPAVYQFNGETVRPLGRENDKSFALVNSLDAAQQKQAILNYQVSDLVLGPGQDGKTIQPEGIKASALRAAQQEMLWDLAHEWVGILNDEGCHRENGRDQKQHSGNLVCVERSNDQWKGRVLPDPGSDAADRVFASASTRHERPRHPAHPHNLPRSDE
ncbi:MAG: DUF3500 domain-containing protein [Pyrinomonadaceae bacterium]|nr:DUF3500 domain-containing protein [Pyrinomonadaceae bacterium]